MDPTPSGPFAKDVLEDPRERHLPPEPMHYLALDTPELKENEFIHEPSSASSYSLWLIVVGATLVIGLIWGVMAWYEGKVDANRSQASFQTVTNRQMSVFLWQFPSFMRVNQSKKNGYLPGFMADRIALDPTTVDDLVVAPPELLFLYHTWKRLLASDYIARPITPQEFAQFLVQEPIWDPQNWKAAPTVYTKLVETKAYAKVTNLETLSQIELPLEVRQAFQGWRNFYRDGEKINTFVPTVAQVEAFIAKHPTYGRSYWRNLEQVEGRPIAGKHYLEQTLQPTKEGQQSYPPEQLAPFLKAALYTEIHSAAS